MFCSIPGLCKAFNHMNRCIFWLCILASILSVQGKIVMRGFDLVEEKELPDDIARIQEIADEADKKFHSASQKILQQMKRKYGRKESKAKPFFRPIDLESDINDVE